MTDSIKLNLCAGPGDVFDIAIAEMIREQEKNKK
jgi:hypothetical protein